MKKIFFFSTFFCFFNFVFAEDLGGFISSGLNYSNSNISTKNITMKSNLLGINLDYNFFGNNKLGFGLSLNYSPLSKTIINEFNYNNNSIDNLDHIATLEIGVGLSFYQKINRFIFIENILPSIRLQSFKNSYALENAELTLVFNAFGAITNFDFLFLISQKIYIGVNAGLNFFYGIANVYTKPSSVEDKQNIFDFYLSPKIKMGIKF